VDLSTSSGQDVIKEIRNLKNVADGIEMDIDSQDIIPRVLPNYFKWIHQSVCFSCVLDIFQESGYSKFETSPKVSFLLIFIDHDVVRLRWSQFVLDWSTTKALHH